MGGADSNETSNQPADAEVYTPVPDFIKVLGSTHRTTAFLLRSHLLCQYYGWLILFGVTVNPPPILPNDNLHSSGFARANYCVAWPCQNLGVFDIRCISQPPVLNASYPVLLPKPHGNGIFGVFKVNSLP